MQEVQTPLQLTPGLQWPIHVFLNGGGVNSIAALCAAAEGLIDYQHFLMAITGSDSENPETLRYYNEIAIPFARKHNLLLWTTRRAGPSLYERLIRPGNTFSGIPMRLSNGKPGRRACTSDYKVIPTDRWILDFFGIREQLRWEQALTRRVVKRAKMAGTPCTYAFAKQMVLNSSHIPRPLAVVGMGIALDEIERARTLHPRNWKKLDYPLLQLRWTREDCIAAIRNAGLPIPPKSACWFCPYKTLPAWRELAEKHPYYFDRACSFEEHFNAGRRSKMWLTDRGVPLREAIRVYTLQGGAPAIDERATFCEAGYCWT